MLDDEGVLGVWVSDYLCFNLSVGHGLMMNLK